MDFFDIGENYLPRKKIIEVYPEFKVGICKDLMIRGNAFYAVWDAKAGLWSTNMYDLIRLVDEELYSYAEEKRKKDNPLLDVKYVVCSMSNFSTNQWNRFLQFAKSCPDNSHELDRTIAFSNTLVNKKDYISKRLPYALQEGSIEAYDKVIGTLYDPEEREKIEWAIGAIINGDSKKIQKFMVFFGDPGTGKSTILELIQKIFESYYAIFEAKSLTSTSNVFSTEQFKNNPLVAIQHDGDLSKIEDNSKLNSIVSHEEIMINEKYKSAYYIRTNCFLLMATNKPVKITDGKAGLIRRLIDIRPSGRKIPYVEYNRLVSQMDFELGAIAYHCLKIYEMLGPSYYNTYKPIDMMYKTDPFFNFVEECSLIFTKEDGVTLKQAYAMYKEYCEETNMGYIMQKYKFREELMNYFENFEEQKRVGDTNVKNYYSGFLKEKFDRGLNHHNTMQPVNKLNWIQLEVIPSKLDELYSDYPAQYANPNEVPMYKWDNVKTTLKDIDTQKLHYVKPPENHVIIDFDLKDENGKKSLSRNLEAASKFPKTYAETSKSGEGLHLHYIWTGGDPKLLCRDYADDIEIKVYTGNSSLRRRLVKCNNIDISELSSGLPMKKGEQKVLNREAVKSEKGLRIMIKKNLNKEIHSATKPSIDFIFKILEDAYDSGIQYDVSDMRNAIFAFAANSTNQSEYCMKLVTKMQFKSADAIDGDKDELYSEKPIAFYDVEVFINLFIINYKTIGSTEVVRMIQPNKNDVEALVDTYRLVGFNCRRYDNHILYGAMMGYNNEQLYRLSQRIVNGESGAMFGAAYNLSYTDIYDYAAKKQSLKKWEIELGIHHQELGLPWDQPVAEELWNKVAEYCDNDVIATEAVWNATQGDFVARQILAEVTGLTVNDTTNSLTTRLIFGTERKPQSEFFYRDLSKPIFELDEYQEKFLTEKFPDMMSVRHGAAKSRLPYFEGYEFKNGKSIYKGDEVGEGGKVWAKPGMYKNVWTFDVASMHPHSALAEYLFGEYTKKFNELIMTRIYIKHKDFDSAKKMFDGKLSKYLDDPSKAKALAQALKIAINSVYGLTAAKFENPFRDIRNIDNIVAKRGALFMCDLKEAVEKIGGEVIHIKTDSIKIVNPSKEIQDFVMKFGRQHGYEFEIEHKFEKICLVNDAVYIAKVSEEDDEYEDMMKDGTSWTATGTQFAVPYVFKKLFSRQPIIFKDLCETKTVSSSLYLDLNEKLDDVSLWENLKKIRYDYNRKGEEDLTKKAKALMDEYSYMSDGEIEHYISKGHNYQFVGKAGLFCPIKPGYGGGDLVRESSNGALSSYASVGGAKGYKWLESEYVENAGLQDAIDLSYYDELADAAIDSLEKYLPESNFTSMEEFLN